MASVHVIVRVRRPDGTWRAPQPKERGERRYLVRYRLAGRDSRLRHLASRRTEREAHELRKWAEQEIAAGRVPRLDLERAATGDTRSVEALVRAEIEARVDVRKGTRDGYEDSLERLPKELRAMRVGELTPALLQAWVNGQVADPEGYGPPSIDRSMALLRRALDRAGVEPNPASKRLVTLPVIDTDEVVPPRADALLALLARLPDHWGPVVAVIEGTGIRVSEAAQLLNRDVDHQGSRIRVHRTRSKRTKGKGRERWIELRPATMALLPRGRRGLDAPVLDFKPNSLQSIMRTHTAARGLAAITPHMLRHRWASRMVMAGVPITVVSERIGHARTSLTHDVYAHALLDDGYPPEWDLADILAAQS